MAKVKEMPTHSEIQRRFTLLKMVNKTHSVLVSELASELGIKKTDLMQIIIDHPDHFEWKEGIKTGRAILTSIK